MDTTQIVIIISIIAVSAIVIGCGIWLIMILRELKTTVIKANSILDDTKMITQSVAEPVSSLSEFVMGFKSGISIFNSLFNKKSKS